jgi:hypothetical protein
MTAAEAMQRIEGHRFAALVNLASNRKTFLRIAAQPAEAEALSRAKANDPAVVSQVLQRAQALAALPADGDREHEADAALATYLSLLSDHRRELALMAAGSLPEPGPVFWARKLAGDLRTADGSANGNGRGGEGETTREAMEDFKASQREP